MNRLILMVCVAMSLVATVGNTHAAGAYPNATVHIIVPFPAGGVADALPRIIGTKLAAKWGQAVVVDNRPGAGGNIGMGIGAHQPADGLTLVLAPAGNLTVSPLLYRHLSFDTAKDFVPVTVLANSPNVLVVNPSVPAHSLKELIAYAKQNPGKLNFASPGFGSGAHLAGELLNIDAGIDCVHIPYGGIAPAVNDLLGGQVQMMFAGISTVLPQIKAGRLVALAIASPQRDPQLPNVPTVAESGLPGFDVTSWYSIVVRSGTPSAIVQKLQHDIAEALNDPEVVAKLSALGLEPVGDSSQEFAALLKSDTLKWSAIVTKANIKPLD